MDWVPFVCFVCFVVKGLKKDLDHETHERHEKGSERRRLVGDGTELPSGVPSVSSVVKKNGIS